MPKLKSTTRSETVTVRLDPKVRYLAELAAREQQRTLSGFIEWAVRKTLTEGELLEDSSIPYDPMKAPLPMWGEGFWDVDEADRFFHLATKRPDLLTLPEQRLWKLLYQKIAGENGELSIVKLRELWNDASTNTATIKEGVS